MRITDTKEFGEALKKQRKQMSYTQADVAAVTGFSASFISELENGKATAEIGKALYLASMLGLDIEIKSRG